MAAPTNAMLLTNVGDETIAAQVDSAYFLLLADRNALPSHPAIYYAGSINGAGSVAIKVPQIGMMGYDALAAEAEADPVNATQLTDASATLTVAAFSKAYTPSDLVRISAKQNYLNPDALAMDAVISGANYLRYLIANVTDDFTATAGSSGVAAAVTDVLDSITTLEIAKVAGPYFGLLHPKQWGDVRKDAGTVSGGGIVFNQGVQGLLDGMKGLGLQGDWLGVTWMTSSDVPTANSSVNRAGGVFGRGAIQWADADVIIEDSMNQIAVGGKVLFERIRLAGNATRWASTRYLAAGIGINAAGVSLITKA